MNPPDVPQCCYPTHWMPLPAPPREGSSPDRANPARDESPKAIEPDQKVLSLLEEADELLGVAWGAMLKLRLGDCGSDTRLPHEVRMFALRFSNEGRDGPGVLQVNGTGEFMAWRKAARALQARARDQARSATTEGRGPKDAEPGGEATRPGERA